MNDRILRKPEVLERTGLSGTTLWREVKAERFPSPVQLSPHRIGWFESSVNAWMDKRQPGACRGVPKRDDRRQKVA